MTARQGPSRAEKWATAAAVDSPESEPSAEGAPQRIVHVITRLLEAGAEENTVATCLHQARSGHEVTLIHGADYHPMWASRLKGSVTLVPLPSLQHRLSPAGDARALWDLWKLMLNVRPHVVHTHQSKAGIVGRIAAAAARVPLIVHTIHIAPFVNVSGLRRSFYLGAEKLCAGFTDVLIAVSRGMRDAFVEAGVGTPAKLKVVHSGMQIAKFANATSPIDWRNRIGGWEAAEQPSIVLMLAAFEQRKRHLPLIRAVAPHLRERPDICLVLAGEGSARATCEAEVRRLGIHSQVRFLGHDRNPEELVALARVCILTSEREGLPRSVIQYLAAGKPVVICDLPGLDEIVIDGVNGVVTDAADLEQTATSLFELLGDELKLERLAAGARSTDVASWEEKTMGQRIQAAYESARPPKPDHISSVEFFGLPGAGKTTVARELIAVLREQHRTIGFSGDIMGDELSFAGRSMRRLLLLRELLRRPLLGARRLRQLMAGNASLKNRAKTGWNYCSVLAMCLRQTRVKAQTLVLDQGIVQAVWSARMHNGDEQRDSYRHLVAEDRLDPCLFVHLTVDPSAARNRLSIRTRKTSRLQNESADQSAQWQKAERLDADLARDIAEELGSRPHGSRMIELRTDGRLNAHDLAVAIAANLDYAGAARAA